MSWPWYVAETLISRSSWQHWVAVLFAVRSSFHGVGTWAALSTSRFSFIFISLHMEKRRFSSCRLYIHIVLRVSCRSIHSITANKFWPHTPLNWSIIHVPATDPQTWWPVCSSGKQLNLIDIACWQVCWSPMSYILCKTITPTSVKLLYLKL